MKEAFGCGTAAVVSPIKGIFYKGTDYNIPINEKYNAGDLTYELNKELNDIQVFANSVFKLFIIVSLLVRKSSS